MGADERKLSRSLRRVYSIAEARVEIGDVKKRPL